MKKIVNLIIALELIICLIVPLVTFNSNVTLSESENRYLASFPKILDDKNHLSPTIISDLIDWFEDNIGLREEMIKIGQAFTYNVIHASTSGKIEIGKEGWLFYALQDNINIASNSYGNFSTEQMENYSQAIKSLSDSLKAEGIEFVVLLPPSKTSIYPEYIASGDYTIIDSVCDQFEDALINQDVKVINTKDSLIEKKNSSDRQYDLYYKTNSHWNDYGSYIAYCGFINKMNEYGLSSTKPIEESFVTEDGYYGDLSKMLGYISLDGKRLTEDGIPVARKINSNAIEVTAGAEYDDFLSLINKKGLREGVMYVNENCEDERTMLIFGDSMVCMYMLDEIAENYKSTCFAWTYEIDKEIIDTAKPDIVVLDVSERLLSSGIPSSFVQYVK